MEESKNIEAINESIKQLQNCKLNMQNDLPPTANSQPLAEEDDKMYMVVDANTGEVHDIRKMNTTSSSTSSVSPDKKNVWKEYRNTLSHINDLMHKYVSTDNILELRKLFDHDKNLITPEINDKSSDGWIALHSAVSMSNYEMAKFLIENHSDLETKCKEERTPLHIACIRGVIDIVSLLVDSGANINAKDISKNTPLHLLCKYCHEDCIKFLLTKQPNETLKNAEGKKAIDMTNNEIIKSILLREVSKEVEGRYVGGSKQQLLKLIEKQSPNKVRPSDFIFYGKLGKGAFGTVYLVKWKNGKEKLYAMKTIEKKFIHQRKIVTYVLAEKNVMQKYRHPFLVGLSFCFQTNDKVFLVMDLCSGGNLQESLEKEPTKRFTEKVAKLYAAEVLLALESLHDRYIIYRDLKPENVMLDDQGHVKITDFGLAKENVKKDDVNKEFCGTISYLAPEIIRNEGYTNAVDWYNFGTLIYTMLQMDPPFFALNKETIFKNIINSVLSFKYPISKEASDLITKLMDKNPKTRLTDSNQIKKHPWFKGINWEDALNRKLNVEKPCIQKAELVEEAPPYHEPEDDKSKHIDLLKTFIESSS